MFWALHCPIRSVPLSWEDVPMRRREPWRYGMLSAALMLAGVMAHACAEEEATYRDLARRYFATGDGKAISKFVGLTEEVKHVVALDYTVLIRKDGREEAVDPKAYQFALGDSIRIKIQPASDNYIYIFHQGASGERTCLLPVDKETPPLLKAGASFILPFDGYFEFVTPRARSRSWWSPPNGRSPSWRSWPTWCSRSRAMFLRPRSRRSRTA